MGDFVGVINILLTAAAVTIVAALFVALRETRWFDNGGHIQNISPTKTSSITSYQQLLTLSDRELEEEHERLQYLYREGICSPLMESRLADIRDAKHRVMIFGSAEPVRLVRQQPKIIDAKFKEISNESRKDSIRGGGSANPDRRLLAFRKRR